jgi:hypothetical protein
MLVAVVVLLLFLHLRVSALAYIRCVKLVGLHNLAIGVAKSLILLQKCVNMLLGFPRPFLVVLFI